MSMNQFMCMGNMMGLKVRQSFFIVDGKIIEIKIKSIKDRKPLSGHKLNDFKVFLEKYADKIVQKWIDYFVYHKDVEFEIINTRIK